MLHSRNGKLGLDCRLHPIVDGQAHRLPTGGKPVILAIFDAAGTDAINIRIAQHMPGQRPAGIGPAALFLEPQPFQSKIEHGLALAGGQAPLHPDKFPTLIRQAGAHFLDIEIGQHTGQGLRHFGAIPDQFRVCDQRIGAD